MQSIKNDCYHETVPRTQSNKRLFSSMNVKSTSRSATLFGKKQNKQLGKNKKTGHVVGNDKG